MPYEITFAKRLTVPDSKIYINECCWGGDIVRDELLPLVPRYAEKLQTGQEDWGWFIWFRRGPTRLSIDICCDDPGRGLFRIRLTSWSNRWSIFAKVADLEELDQLRDLIAPHLKTWAELQKVEHEAD